MSDDEAADMLAGTKLHSGDSSDHDSEWQSESEASDNERERTIYDSFMRREEDLDTEGSKSDDRIHDAKKRRLLNYLSETSMETATLVKYACISSGDVDELMIKYGHEIRVLCKCLQASIEIQSEKESKTSDVDEAADMLAATGLHSGEEIDNAIEMMSSLGMKSEDNGLSRFNNEKHVIIMMNASIFFDFVMDSILTHRDKPWKFKFDLYEMRMKAIFPAVFDKQVEGNLSLWPTPIISMNFMSVYDSSLTPYLTYLLRRLMDRVEVKNDWTVLFNTSDRFDTNKPIPHHILASLKKEYSKIDPSVKKVVILLNCYLIKPILSKKSYMMILVTRFGDNEETITALDEHWVIGNSGTTHLDYVCRMKEIADCLAMDPVKIILSKAVESRVRLSLNSSDQGDERFKQACMTVSLISWTAYKKEEQWLADLLRSNRNKTRSCLYELDVCLKCCITETSYSERMQVETGFDDFSGTVDHINTNLFTGTLMGFALLSPACAQWTLNDIYSPGCCFVTVDGGKNVPSDTYCWALAKNEEGKNDIFALKYDSRYLTNFHWTKLNLQHYPKIKSKQFLGKLIDGARDSVDVKKRRQHMHDQDSDPEEEDPDAIQMVRRMRRIRDGLH